ncbi:MAG TPA: 16S rRNA (guanine(966)-N(2))-methyltransferase RsmD [Candidatus Omnitrophota bacterium]|nr:16S rRNA (guanine(966)-N(2))-methyltransferase RsmD [Candidatus Omnitrophota bacterium]
MRIIGGLYKSRLIEMPKGTDIRPTQDKVRQAVFNILRDVNGMRALDLYAGSGAYGIEAISRGAGHATFVENNARCVQTISSNLQLLKVDSLKYDIIRLKAEEAVSRLGSEAKLFDLVFVDPPYYEGLAKKCLITLDACDILAQSALVVIEHYKRDDLPAELTKLKLLTERRYSDTKISIFRAG